MGLPDSSQPITIVIVGAIMAIRCLEAHVKENNRQGGAYERTVTGIGLSKRFRSF